MLSLSKHGAGFFNGLLVDSGESGVPAPPSRLSTLDCELRPTEGQR